MRDSFVGDIGDLGRSGMLRELFGKPEATDSDKSTLHLGVVWCLNEANQEEGKFTPATYKNLRYLDTHLYDTLDCLVKERKRTVLEFERKKILNTNIFFRKPLSGLKRVERKEKWLEEALKKTKEANVIFIDPDNGIATKTMTKADPSKEFPKHIFIDELKQFYDKGKSLIIYQDSTQGHKKCETSEMRIESVSQRLKANLKPNDPQLLSVWALRWQRKSGRVYFIVVHPDHKDTLNPQVQKFVNDPKWFTRQPKFRSAHFKNVKLT